MNIKTVKNIVLAGIVGIILTGIGLQIKLSGIAWKAGATLTTISITLDRIKEDTGKIPDMATNIKILLDRSNREYIQNQLKRKNNPHIKVCEKMIPDEIKEEIQNILKENIDISLEDLSYLLDAKMDYNLILNKAQEKNIPFDKYLDYITAYAICYKVIKINTNNLKSEKKK